MVRRVTAWALAGTLAAAAVIVTIVSCSNGSPVPVDLAHGCSINSDCKAPLVCVFGLCHEACAESRDCPQGQRCVQSGGDKVCELPSESSCAANPAACPQGLVCGSDQQCRNACNNVGDCIAGQVCQGSACYDPGELDGGADGSSGDSSVTDSGNSFDSPNDGPAVEAGPLGFVPSNFGTVTIADGGVPEAGEGGVSVVGADGGIDWSSAPDVTITANCGNACLPPHLVITQGDGSHADLYVMKSLTVDSSTTLTPTDAVPVIFAVLGAVDVQGTINVAANGYFSGPGAPAWIGPTGPQGPGGGGNGYSANYPTSGGGGGSLCGIGGKGGAPSGAQAPGGSAYGNATLTPLVAGSGGGNVAGYAWGAGGGGIQISSGTSILVRAVGIINAGGGGGSYGGGGSGGAILLEAPTITIQGNVVANGGGGGAYATTGSTVGANAQASSTPAAGGSSAGSQLGGNGSAATATKGADGTFGDAAIDVGCGGGGAGYIRLNSSSGKATVSGTVSPDLTSSCATQGTLP
ncbi:MAG TPA: hypothetical protein VIF15_12910 [Polyangiaceae bacterium]|jgi:hypothetical protein